MEKENPGRKLSSASSSRCLTKAEKKVRAIAMKTSTEDLIKFASVTSFDQVWRASKRIPRLERIVQFQSKGEAQKAIAKILTHFNDLLNSKSKLSAPHILYLSQEILARYPKYVVSEIALVFRNAINGDYGSTYGELDVMKALEWFSKYDKDRSERISVLKYQEDTQQKEEFKKMTPEGKKLMTKIFQSWEKKVKQEKREEFKQKPVWLEGVQYVSWQQYCDKNEIDFEQFTREMNVRLSRAYDNAIPGVDRDIWIAMRAQALLHELNGMTDSKESHDKPI